MAKKNLKNEIRHESTEKEIDNEKTEVKAIKKEKKKMTNNEKRKLVFKIVGWIMAISMLFGSIIAFFAPLMYK